MIIKIMYHADVDNPEELDGYIFGQEVVFETETYSIKTVNIMFERELFADIVTCRFKWVLPEGIEPHMFDPDEPHRDPLKNSDSTFNPKSDNPILEIPLLYLPGKEHPILLSNCVVFIMNDKGTTIDKLECI